MPVGHAALAALTLLSRWKRRSRKKSRVFICIQNSITNRLKNLFDWAERPELIRVMAERSKQQ